MRKVFSKRIRITKNGKVLRRKMSVCHFRSKKSSGAKQERRKFLGLDYPMKSLIKRVKN